MEHIQRVTPLPTILREELLGEESDTTTGDLRRGTLWLW